MSPGDILRHYYKDAYPTDLLDVIDSFFSYWNLLDSSLLVLAMLNLFFPTAEKTKRLLFLIPLVTYGVYQLIDFALSVMYLGTQVWFRLHNMFFLAFYLLSYVHSR